MLGQCPVKLNVLIPGIFIQNVPPADDLKPPPYTEHATGSIEEACALSIPEGYDACSLSDAPPPYTPSPTVEITQQNTVMLSGTQESDNASSADSPCQV